MTGKHDQLPSGTSCAQGVLDTIVSMEVCMHSHAHSDNDAGIVHCTTTTSYNHALDDYIRCHICTHTKLYACMHFGTQVPHIPMCALMCTHACPYGCTHPRMQTSNHACTCACTLLTSGWTQTRMYMHHARIRACTHVCMHINMHAHRHDAYPIILGRARRRCDALGRQGRMGGMREESV